MSDNTPTQRFDAPVPPESEVVQEEKKNRGLLIALIVVGAVILIAIIVLLIVLLGGQGKPVAVDTTTPTPSASSASPTPSATPTPTVTPTPTSTTAPPPPPASTKPSITGYSINPSKVDCSGTTPNLSIHWSSVNGKNAYFGVNTADAMTGGMGWVLPASGSDADFPDGYRPYPAQCGNTSTEYTITILGNDGSKVSKQFVVTKK